jgi:hypothetical protein
VAADHRDGKMLQNEFAVRRKSAERAKDGGLLVEGAQQVAAPVELEPGLTDLEDLEARRSLAEEAEKAILGFGEAEAGMGAVGLGAGSIGKEARSIIIGWGGKPVERFRCEQAVKKPAHLGQDRSDGIGPVFGQAR